VHGQQFQVVGQQWATREQIDSPIARVWSPRERNTVLLRLNTDFVVHGTPELLFTPEIALGRLNRDVPK
jgi:NADPH-dependent ferric siderophore reductase